MASGDSLPRSALCGQLIFIFFNNEILQCQKLCKHLFRVHKFFITLKRVERTIFLILIIRDPEVTLYPTKNLGPIGSAVLPFSGYKQTDRQAKFINRLIQICSRDI